MVSQTLGWFREFRADPGSTKTIYLRLFLFINYCVVEERAAVFYDLPMKGNADGTRKNKPSLYMVNVTTKYMTKLPKTKKVFTAVQ